LILFSDSGNDRYLFLYVRSGFTNSDQIIRGCFRDCSRAEKQIALQDQRLFVTFWPQKVNVIKKALRNAELLHCHTGMLLLFH
jgi:hypothetical protein